VLALHINLGFFRTRTTKENKVTGSMIKMERSFVNSRARVYAERRSRGKREKRKG